MITIKTDRELELMRISSRIVGETFEYVRSLIKPGVTTQQLDEKIESFIVRQGARPAFKGLYGFPASACISIDEEVVHGIPSRGRVLEEGQLVSVDIGVEYRGYYGDAAFTFPVGEVEETKRRLMEVTWESLFVGIEKAVAGNRVQDISASIQQFVEARGFNVVRNLTGHGIGRALHEDPQVPNYGKPGRGPQLRAGMTLAIEPMVNAGTAQVFELSDGWTIVTADRRPSAHYEHTVLITDGEPEILTKHSLNPLE
ncbi:MAG: type I methionyl aminopeptidase [Calditrichaeota bacterium]|nr:MAG: type I methionyl aminopeptidase [Calditrichota bacterium]